MIKLSLCIVTYNNNDVIKKTIENIIGSIPENLKYRLHIVDNNSQDNTVEIIKKINGNINIIQLKKNIGFGRGHNEILEIIESDYHIIINPDILIKDSTQIKKMIDYMEVNKDIGILSPLIRNEDMSIQKLCKLDPTVFDMFIRKFTPNLFLERQKKYTMDSTNYNHVFDVEYLSGSFMVFRTKIFKKIEGFDKRYFMYMEDADISRKARSISRVIFFNNAEVIHTWNRENHRKLKMIKATIVSMFKYFNKWGWKLF